MKIMIKKIIDTILIFFNIKETPNLCADCVNRLCVSNTSPCYNCIDYCNYEYDSEYIPEGVEDGNDT